MRITRRISRFMDRRDEIVVMALALIIPLITLPAMIGF